LIATLKVLGLKARGAHAIAAAARRVVEYVQGAPAGDSPGLARYYADSSTDPARGVARGSAAELVGLRDRVLGGQLERLLTGRHAVTGAPLLPAAGSAGRASARHAWAAPPVSSGGLGNMITLVEAAQAAGVSPQYLRRLAEENALLAAVTEPDEDWERPAARDRLRAEREPATGRWLVSREDLARFVAEREPPTVVIGYDLVCAAPKSVSLLWALGDDALRGDIAAAMDAGVDAATGYLQRHAAVGTVGGRNRTSLGLAVASYTHEVSRADEAHLHVHNIIANATPVPAIDDAGQPVLGPDGVARVEWRALDSEVLHAHVKTAGYLGAAALRHTLASRRGLRWTKVRNGVAELDGFPPALLGAFSTRHGETHEEFIKLVEAGFTPDAATLAARSGPPARRRSPTPMLRWRPSNSAASPKPDGHLSNCAGSALGSTASPLPQPTRMSATCSISSPASVA